MVAFPLPCMLRGWGGRWVGVHPLVSSHLLPFQDLVAALLSEEALKERDARRVNTKKPFEPEPVRLGRWGWGGFSTLSTRSPHVNPPFSSPPPHQGKEYCCGKLPDGTMCPNVAVNWGIRCSNINCLMPILNDAALVKLSLQYVRWFGGGGWRGPRQSHCD